MNGNSTFDYVIIGAGTAGALMANRLSADPESRVLLIEAGPRDNYHWIHIPAGYLYCIGNPRTDWMYHTEPDAGLNGRSLRYPRGKIVGGCSSINGMIYMRGQSRDYDRWAELTGDDTWNWANVLPAFRQHEDHHLGTGNDPDFADYHGAGGEWHVAKQRLRWDILDAFAQAAHETGIAPCSDFNRGNNDGVGYFEVNQKNGWRWNSAKAFLRHTCYRRRNFKLWTQAQVVRIDVTAQSDGRRRCTGAQVWDGRQMTAVHAAREVILCAGSIGSPQILQLSGIGPGDLLRRHGIDVVLDAPGVGANLQDHLQIRAVYKIDGAPTLNALASSLHGKAMMGLEYLLRRTGPLSMAPSQLGAFTRSSPEKIWPDLEYHVQPLSLDAFGGPLHAFPAFTASVCNLNPTSRGTVRIKSPQFDTAPAIVTNYLSTDEDRKTAVGSLRLTRRIVAQPALAKYRPVEWKPGVEYASHEDLLRLVGDIATTIFHPVGTTKMGAASDPMAVLDARLRVRGIAGLRVVDAGAMPTITSGNTNSPALMMAEKAAAWIRAERVAQSRDETWFTVRASDATITKPWADTR